MKLRWRGNKHLKIVTMTQKRRLHQTLPICKRLKVTKPKPKHYNCPEGYAYVETIKGRTRVRVLLDSCSNIFLINQNLVKNLHIPYETRQTALPILIFEGTNASYIGKHYTHPILLEIGRNGHRSHISFEIAPCREICFNHPIWMVAQ